MTVWWWIPIALLIWILIDLVLLLFGLTGALVWLATAFYHGLFRLPDPPGVNDDNWSRDQGKEAE